MIVNNEVSAKRIKMSCLAQIMILYLMIGVKIKTCKIV